MSGTPSRDESKAWAILARTPGFDREALRVALERWGDPAAIVAAGRRGLSAASGLPARSAEFLTSAAAQLQTAERQWLDGEQHHLIACTDPRFPPLLLELPDCPIALYVCGATAPLVDPQIAIVGSRNPTPQGRQNAAVFAEGLGERGLGIVSGAADGIDAVAHRGALAVQATTLAVLGTGIDVVYPRCNRELFANLAASGTLISEFPLRMPPLRGNFPRRNRLIAGMSLGTLVIEASRRSGSLITARLANTYGREVFAIPGSIHNPLARGCHELIKDGASLVESTADILRELNFSTFFSNDLRQAKAARPAPPPAPGGAPGMDKDRKILLDALGFDPVDLDTVVVRTGFKPATVSSMMLILELEGHVQAAPGGRYSRVVYRRAGGER